MAKLQQRGATLIELMISLVILGIILGLGVPAFKDFLASTRLRSGAESVLAGLQLARAEAIRRNTPVCFHIDSSGVWEVFLDHASLGLSCNNSGKTGYSTQTGDFVQKSSSIETNGLTIVSTISNSSSTTADTVTFDAFGKKKTVNTDGSTPIQKMVFTISSLDSSKYSLQINISDTGGQIKMCDPNVSTANDPRQCPQDG